MNMRSLVELGNHIAKVREQKEYTQEGLAEKLGCQPNSLSRWENGNTAMKIDTFAAIIDVLGVSADELLGTKASLKNQNMQNMGALLQDVSDISVENLYMLQSIVKAVLEALKSLQN